MVQYIWQTKTWPYFRWKSDALLRPLGKSRQFQGRLLGEADYIGLEMKAEVLTEEAFTTAALISQYWPDRPVAENKLALNMGIMNLVSPFFGGMPMCHGAGGLAGQYYFGARTGGTNLLEGAIEILMGLFLAASIATLLALFPQAIIGAMMFMVGIEMVRFARDLSGSGQFVPAAATVVVSVFGNMAFGFVAGIVVHRVMEKWKGRDS